MGVLQRIQDWFWGLVYPQGERSGERVAFDEESRGRTDKYVRMDSLSYRERWMEAARHGVGLDVLIHDESPNIRREAVRRLAKLPNAELDEYLRHLVQDPDPSVRIEVAKLCMDIDRPETVGMIDALIQLEGDSDPAVRLFLVEQDWCVEEFVNDPDESVRIAVAKQGVGLDVLRNDRSLVVQDAVWDYEHKGDKSRTVSDIVTDAGSRDFEVSRGNKEKIEMELC